MSYYVYILTNEHANVLYVGVTNDLKRRVHEHQTGAVDGFTKRYNVHKLVYFEECDEADDAIAREKQIKGWKRWKKDELVGSMNPSWEDLAQDWF